MQSRTEDETPNTAAETVIPLAAEEIAVAKQVVETGRVQISRVTHERKQLIDEMLGLEAARRAVEPGVPSDLAGAMSMLAREVGCAEEYCLQRLAEVGAELGRRRGPSTGLRDGGGQVLGRV